MAYSDGIESLLATGLKDFQLSIGNVEYFKEFVQRLVWMKRLNWN